MSANRDVRRPCAGLVKRYRDGPRRTAASISTCCAARVVAMLGPNGAGKTTFLRQLTTELAPDRRRHQHFRRRRRRRPAAREAAHGHLAAGSRRLRGAHRPRSRGAVRAAQGTPPRASAKAARRRRSTELGLSADAERRVGTLSGGQRRRVLIGLALLGSPPLLVLDEPTTGLDPASRRALWGVLLRAVRGRRNRHSLDSLTEEAERLSDRIAIISAGRLIALGHASRSRGESA